MSLNIVDFPIVLKVYSDANWIFDLDETNLLVVIDSHLDWAGFMEIDQTNNYC